MNKDEYILRSISKISKKRLEFFVVTRVIHALENFDIEFVTQQLVRRSEKKYALTDMYFPQFELHLEIDEDHHKKEANQVADSFRSKDIVLATSHQIERIDASLPLMQIANQTDAFIKKLLKLRDIQISRNKFVPWDFDKRYSPELYRDMREITVAQNVLFKRQANALRLFGYMGGDYQRGTWKIPNGNGDFVWFPRLYQQKNWDNELTSDGKMIVERALFKSDKKIIYKEDCRRVVFARASDMLGHTLYRYVGAFKHNPEQSSDGLNYFYIVDEPALEISLPPEGSYTPLI